MRRVNFNMHTLKEQIELIDILSDTANEEDMLLLDGIANFLDLISSGEVYCFYKDNNGITE